MDPSKQNHPITTKAIICWQQNLVKAVITDV